MIKVAAVQAGPIYLDLGRSLEKAIALIGEAASLGAKRRGFADKSNSLLERSTEINVDWPSLYRGNFDHNGIRARPGSLLFQFNVFSDEFLLTVTRKADRELRVISYPFRTKDHSNSILLVLHASTDAVVVR